MESKIQSIKNLLTSHNFKIFASLGVLFVNAVFSVYMAQKLFAHRLDIRTRASQEIKGAVLRTNYGDIEIAFSKKSPKTVQNFVSLTQSNFYDQTRFHRVVDGLLIEGGDPLSKNTDLKTKWGNGGPGYVFDDEIHDDDLMVKTTVAMVNNGPNTNGSQFFILVSDASWLKGENTIFAYVKEGFDVVERISKLPVGVTGIPIDDVILEKVILK